MVTLAHRVGARAAVLLVVLAGCGNDPGPSALDEPTSTPTLPDIVTTEDGELVVGCGGLTGWPVSVMAEGIPDVLTDDEAEAIFAELLADPELAPELELTFLSAGAEDTEWRVLSDNGDAYTFGLGDWSASGPDDDAYVMDVQDHADGWGFGGGGSCQLQPVLGADHTWVNLTLPTAGLDLQSSSPTIGVTERECTSGRDPRPFLHDPEVVETDDSVTVYWTSQPMTEGANCIGAAPTEVTLDLDSPIGDRELMDGSSYPALPIPASLFG